MQHIYFVEGFSILAIVSEVPLYGIVAVVTGPVSLLGSEC